MLRSHLARLTAALAKSRGGATAIEYGLLAALVAVAITAGASALGGAMNSKLDGTASAVTSAGG